MSADELKSWLSIAGVIVGAGWALMKIFFSQKEKIENLEKQSVMQLISQTQAQIQGLSNLMREISDKFSKEINEIKKETADLRVIQAEHVTEMKTFGKAMLEVHRHFAGEKEQHPSSEKVSLGKDTWLIREKKKGENG